MAIDLTAYASAQEYRDRNGRVSTSDDTMVDALLLAVSRVVERRCWVAPGHFKSQTALAYTFTATGGSVLYLRDERGWQHYLRSVTADKIEVDSEVDGTFDGYVLDLADAWVVGYPTNASTYSEPYTALRIRPGVANADPTSWVEGVEVRITGDWGYASTPGAIKERVIGITRELIDVHRAGAALTVNAVDDMIQRHPTARSLMSLLEEQYSARLPL